MEYFWEKIDWETEDRHLKALSKMPFQRPISFIPDKPGLFVMRGPRQIGKSTWLKTVLKHHVDQKEKCFYLSCENVMDYQELKEILDSTKDRKVILLDEVTFVPEWFRPMKHTLDSGDERIFILTGSNTVDLRKGADRMPGRWGNGGEFELLPMDFSEFQKMRQQAGWKEMNSIDELKLFFTVGGFPFALLEAGPKGIQPKKAIKTYQSWLEGDFLKLGKQSVYLKELCYQISQSITSSVSLQKLAQRTQISSHHTVQEYIHTLENCFALKTLYALDPNTGSYRFRKEKKFYFTDPLCYFAALDWGGEIPRQGSFEQLAEMMAHEYLSRKHPRMGYYSTKDGEVDFYSKQKSWAIEVKWTPVVQKISSAYKNLIVANKKVWHQGNFFEDY